MALTPVSTTTPSQSPVRHIDPAFAGKYGYRALGAYSSGLDTGGNTLTPIAEYSPQSESSTPNFFQQRTAQAKAVWDASKKSFKTGNPNFVVDAAQSTMINDADRFENKVGIDTSPVSATLKVDRDIHQTINKAASGTVICTELVRRGDATPYDLSIEYRFVSKIPAFIVRGYRVWAVPYVCLMRKSLTLYAMTRPFAKAFMQESAAVLGLQKHSVLGAAIILFGLPVCAAIGAISIPLLTPCEV